MRTFPGIPRKENQGGGGGTKERGELYHEGGSRSGERMQESPSSSSSLFIILADKHALAFSAVQHRGRTPAVPRAVCWCVLCRVSPSPLRSGGVFPATSGGEWRAREGLGHGSPQPGQTEAPADAVLRGRAIQKVLWFGVCSREERSDGWAARRREGGSRTTNLERWLVPAPAVYVAVC